nr:MAG TPA: hypothetical protein [Caudoviricetes sp.]
MSKKLLLTFLRVCVIFYIFIFQLRYIFSCMYDNIRILKLNHFYRRDKYVYG